MATRWSKNEVQYTQLLIAGNRMQYRKFHSAIQPSGFNWKIFSSLISFSMKKTYSKSLSVHDSRCRWHRKKILNPRGQFVSFSISWHIDDGEKFLSVCECIWTQHGDNTTQPKCGIEWENPFSRFSSIKRLPLNDFYLRYALSSTIAVCLCFHFFFFFFIRCYHFQHWVCL